METIVDERGQVSIPELLLREMHLEPGQTVRWQKISDTEYRFSVLAAEPAEAVVPNPKAALGFARRHGLNLPWASTADYMREIRGDDYADETEA